MEKEMQISQKHRKNLNFTCSQETCKSNQNCTVFTDHSGKQTNNPKNISIMWTGEGIGKQIPAHISWCVRMLHTPWNIIWPCTIK